jgi:DNA polymerase-3 subunit beta
VDLVSQLIDGNYPDYNAIVPRKKEARVVVNTAEMLKACKAASVFARESQNTVKLTIAAGAPRQIVVQSTSAETGDNVGQVDATVEGEFLFHSRRTSDLVRAASAS